MAGTHQVPPFSFPSTHSLSDDDLRPFRRQWREMCCPRIMGHLAHSYRSRATRRCRWPSPCRLYSTWLRLKNGINMILRSRFGECCILFVMLRHRYRASAAAAGGDDACGGAAGQWRCDDSHGVTAADRNESHGVAGGDADQTHGVEEADGDEPDGVPEPRRHEADRAIAACNGADGGPLALDCFRYGRGFLSCSTVPLTLTVSHHRHSSPLPPLTPHRHGPRPSPCARPC